jgi:hypothetical protein
MATDEADRFGLVQAGGHHHLNQAAGGVESQRHAAGARAFPQFQRRRQAAQGQGAGSAGGHCSRA